MSIEKNLKPAKAPTRSKKSETLEVRIPYETKQAFLSACREDGTTASEVVRESVQIYLDERERPPIPEKRTLVMKLPQPVRHYGPRIAAGGLAAIGLATFAVLPSAAAPDFKAQFSRLDTNKDGVLSPDEFLGPKDDSKDAKNVVVSTTTHAITIDTRDGDHKPDWKPANEEDSFTFWLPDELGGAKQDEHQEREFKFITRREVTDKKDGDAPVMKTFSFSMDDMRRKEFESIDTNKDGKVSLEEYKARQTAMLTRGFDMLDKDGDKVLSEDEYAKIVAPPVIRIKGDGPDAPEPPVIEMSGMNKVTPEQIKAAFTRLDANHDGKLSLKEYLPPS